MGTLEGLSLRCSEPSSGSRLPVGCPGATGLCEKHGSSKRQLWTQAGRPGWDSWLHSFLTVGFGAFYLSYVFSVVV